MNFKIAFCAPSVNSSQHITGENVAASLASLRCVVRWRITSLLDDGSANGVLQMFLCNFRGNY